MKGWKYFLNSSNFRFQSNDFLANSLMLSVVDFKNYSLGVSDIIIDTKVINVFSNVRAGDHSLSPFASSPNMIGARLPFLNLPLGVMIVMTGGLKGY